MSAAAHVDHRNFDQLCRWSRTGRDGACPKPHRVRCRGARQSLSDVILAVAIALGRRIVSPSLADPSQPQRPPALAAPIVTVKSP